MRLPPHLLTWAAAVVAITLHTKLHAELAGAPAPSIDVPLPAPGMGWSTYNFFGPRHNEALLLKMADAFDKSGLLAAGYNILRIDGGWWGDDGSRRWYYWTEGGKYEGGAGYAAGDPHVDARNYPRGIKPLADDLHAKGLSLGFYLAPELSTGASANFPGNKEAPVQPATGGNQLVAQHARWVADSGIDHLFFDGYDWGETKGIDPYTTMFQSLRTEARRAGRPIIFSINTGWKGRPKEWADEWRTGRDIDGQWSTILECLSGLAEPGPAGRGHWNNPDYLMVGFIGDEEAKSQMSLWCIAGAPLYLSHDFRVLNVWDRYVLLNTEAIAVDQDHGGTPGSRVRTLGPLQIWVRPLDGGAKAVVVLNAGEAPQQAELKWADIGLAQDPAQVRDLWAHANLGAVAGAFSTELPPHGCAFLRVEGGTAGHAPLHANWAPDPGAKPSLAPLPSKGWTARTDMPRKDDPLANLLDGDPKTGWWSYAEPGQSLEIDFGKPIVFDRLVIDHAGRGPNVWPYRVLAPRSTYILQASDDGHHFSEIAADSFGPVYTLATFKPTSARYIRIVIDKFVKTSFNDDATFNVKDIYLFNTRGPAE